jgi:hypothetical protein
MIIIDLSLKNESLYSGCEIETVAGRMNLVTPIAEAIEVIGENISTFLESVPGTDRNVVTLTGPMAVWAYLIVFHAVVHLFREVKYNDGRGEDILIARHGHSFMS